MNFYLNTCTCTHKNSNPLVFESNTDNEVQQTDQWLVGDFSLSGGWISVRSRRTLRAVRSGRQPSSSEIWCSCLPTPSCTTTVTIESTRWPSRCTMTFYNTSRSGLYDTDNGHTCYSKPHIHVVYWFKITEYHYLVS